jgi:hypothetical protein
MVWTSGQSFPTGRLLLCALLLLRATGALVAHTVPVEQQVIVDVRLEQAALTVHMHMPIDALTGSGLPRSLDGTLAPDVPPGQLDTIAADAIRNLNLRADQTLRPTRLTSAASADRTALDVDATFPVSTLDGVQARLNAFQIDPLRPVATTLHVHRADGRTLDMRVSGAAATVTLDPDTNDVLSEFAALAAHVVIGWGNEVLVLLCLLAIPLSAGAAAGRVSALLIAQLAGMAMFALSGGAIGSWMSAVSVFAASLVVVAGLHAALGARRPFVFALAVVFGLLNGAGLAVSLAAELPSAGVHPSIAAATFTGFVVVVEAWMAAIGFALRRWLVDRGVRDSVVAYGVAGFAVHTALHRFADAGAALAGSESFAATHAVVLTTLGWAVVILIVAAVEAQRRHNHVRREPALAHGGS